MGLSALFGMVYMIFIREKWARILTGVYALSIGLTFINVPVIKHDAYYLFTILCIAAVLYAWSMPGFSENKKIMLTVAAVGSTLPNIFLLAAWPMDIPAVTALISLGTIGYILFKKREEFHNEIGMLAILGTNSLITFFLYLVVRLS